MPICLYTTEWQERLIFDFFDMHSMYEIDEKFDNLCDCEWNLLLDCDLVILRYNPEKNSTI